MAFSPAGSPAPCSLLAALRVACQQFSSCPAFSSSRALPCKLTTPLIPAMARPSPCSSLLTFPARAAVELPDVRARPEFPVHSASNSLVARHGPSCARAPLLLRAPNFPCRSATQSLHRPWGLVVVVPASLQLGLRFSASSYTASRRCSPPCRAAHVPAPFDHCRPLHACS
ncbi:uncharacterized protein LOC100273951 [Zea mays]|uniref:Uncharacterized protein n=1 Tax=Zea mays TaxID=4577 RepID=B4FYA2_MAIZE|nr:uncharacterized protein LOC100273951 [Zea mays]ACF87095.1 unknown [Zea mays]|eukprot:NP_001141812.1 uncharacterized protein LOC100273951 [Zea mays]